jgi:hypothetical protein
MAVMRTVIAAGQVFGCWTVVDPDVGREKGSGALLVLARCYCGAEKVHAVSALRRSRCCRECSQHSAENRANLERMAQLNITHGMWGHPLYVTWQGMMDRCYDPGATGYQYYGGRGIEVCAEWHDAGVFIRWVEVNLGSRPEGRTLDRFPDNDGNYEPGNVRWATWSEQNSNQRRGAGTH